MSDKTQNSILPWSSVPYHSYPLFKTSRNQNKISISGNDLYKIESIDYYVIQQRVFERGFNFSLNKYLRKNEDLKKFWEVVQRYLRKNDGPKFILSKHKFTTYRAYEHGVYIVHYFRSEKHFLDSCKKLHVEKLLST